jgi:hypothetical protein
MFENFEGKNLTLNFTGDWSVSPVSPYAGTKCYKSKSIATGETSSCELIYTAGSNGGYCEFLARVSSKNLDNFVFTLDGAQALQPLSGEVAWTQFACGFAPGQHVLRWSYTKASGSAAGEDAVYIDNVNVFNLKTVDFMADTLRITHKDVSSLFFVKTLRAVHKSVSLKIGTKRIVAASTAFKSEMVRRLPVVLSPVMAQKSPTGIKSIAITIAAKTISDTFAVETVKPLNINDAVQGNILDFEYSFLVEASRQTEDVQSITGMYDVDLLLCTPISYSVPNASGASRHAEAIADALGKSAVVSIDDFQSSADLSTAGATYKNIISSLFGWTSSLPQRQINVFLRRDKFYVIQRGRELGNIEIKAPHTRPEIARKIIRSMWSGNGSDTSTSVVVSPIPFSGSIEFGDQSAAYAGGLLVSESHGDEVTTYSYSNGCVSRKTRSGSKSTSTTVYDYAHTSNDTILGMETETIMDLTTTPPTKSVRVTRHVAIGHGFYGTTVEADGEPVGASMGQGKPGGKASIFCINEANRSMGSEYSSGSVGKKLPGSSLIDTNFPVVGESTLRMLTEAIEWLNGKIEERIIMDVFAMDSIIDFTKTVTFDGNIYFLEKNTIIQDPKTNKQSIELVRWY